MPFENTAIHGFIAEVITVGGSAAAIAYVLFKTLGKGWLDNYFQTRIQELQHNHAIELSKFKQRLDTTASSLGRIHQKEFEVLPEAWALLDEAISELRAAVSPMQSYTDVATLEPEDFREILEGRTTLTASHKARLLGLTGQWRQKEFNKLLDWERSRRAMNAIADFQKFTARNSVFLPEQLGKQFDEIREVLWAASTSKTVGMEVEDWSLQREGWRKVEQQAEPLFLAIRKSIQDRIAKQAEIHLGDL